MALEFFSGDHLPTLLSRIRTTLGPDACIVQLRRRGAAFELVASDGTGSYAAVPRPAAEPVAPDFRDILDAEVARDPIAHRATPAPLLTQPSKWAPASAVQRTPAPPERPAFMVRPWVVALVGPTGAGKTTTIAKLATNPLAFGGCRVGLIGLDTYRVGAVEQLETYADIAGLPIAIAYTEAEIDPAVARMNDCEVILVDTPGRGPRNASDSEVIRTWLARLAPDEVHLTLPAGQLPAVTRRLLRSYEAFGVTHLIATKLDEYPAESAIFNVSHEHSRAMRWVTDGQEVPGDLRIAADALASALARRDGAVAMEAVA